MTPSRRSQTGSSTNQWLFTGEQRDVDSSFYCLRARYYDPAIGRFLTWDPVASKNRYTYVGKTLLVGSIQAVYGVRQILRIVYPSLSRT